MKKKQLKEMQKKGNRRDPNSSVSKKFHKRIQEKVETRSRPTRSKIIMKERKTKRKR